MFTPSLSGRASHPHAAHGCLRRRDAGACALAHTSPSSSSAAALLCLLCSALPSSDGADTDADDADDAAIPCPNARREPCGTSEAGLGGLHTSSDARPIWLARHWQEPSHESR